MPPLAGLRVLELGQLIAGPYCGQVFADFGADVVKVELPGAGDPMRQWGEMVDDHSLSWSVIARGKRLVTADLKTESGRDLVRRLMERADVVIENFRPGTLERHQLAWKDLAESNPRLIMIRLSGFGQSGPYASRPGYGSIGEAMGGLRYLTGDPDQPPSRIGVSIGDTLAGIHGVIGGLLALRTRERTGRGQEVDVSIYESVLAVTEALVSEYAVAGKVRERSGPLLPGIAPSNLYPTRDGNYVIVAANQDTVFRRLAAAMGRPELAESQEFGTHVARGVHQIELDDVVAAWTAEQETDELLALLLEHSVPAGRLYRAVDMLADPHYAARRSIVVMKDEHLGDVPMQNVFPRLAETPGVVRWTGGGLAQHQQEVISDWLGDSASSATP